jgi:ribose transport system permease protein
MARTSAPAPAPAPAVPARRALWHRSRAAVRDLWIGGVLLALIVAFSIDSPYFLTRANWLNTSSTGTEVLLLAVGETFVICAGGLVNGFLVAWAGVPPFVVTLGTLGIATGFGYLLNNGQEISAIPGSVTTFGNDNLGGWVPVPVLITAVITIWCGLLLARTRFGAYALSIGDSREAVVRAGVNDRRYLLEIYTLSGVLAGVASVLVMARLGAGSPDSGATDNLNAIAAVVIGGASLFGGRGSFVGCLLGALLLTQINTVTTFLDLDDSWQSFLLGAMILASVTLYSASRRMVVAR